MHNHIGILLVAFGHQSAYSGQLDDTRHTNCIDFGVIFDAPTALAGARFLQGS